MEDTLKRLLEAETRAEQLVTQATLAREQKIQQALQAARRAEQEFEAQLPELQISFLEKSESRAQQSISELQKRYEDKKSHLRDLAEKNQQNALDATVALLMQVDKSL